MKTCSKCHSDKEDEFFPKVGKRCKKCISEYRIAYDEKNRERLFEYNKKWRNENNETLILYKKDYYEDNKEIILSKNKDYREKNRDNISLKKKEYDKVNKDKIAINKKKWRDNNKDYQSKYIKNRCINDNLFNLTFKIRSLIRLSFTYKGLKKNSKTSQILGCSFEEFKLYLESNFEPWMNWENYGRYNGELNYGWDIDHKIPLSSAVNEEEVVKLNHFSNLQPLCSYLNRVIKRNN